jgi:F0F1-type ATP synthase assembly protein I
MEAARRLAMRVVLGQVVVTLGVAAAFAAVSGAGSGRSALVGGGIGVLATAFMAFALLRHRAGAGAGRIAGSFYLGWAIKVAMTVALLVIAFRSPGLAPLPVLAAFFATFCAYWLAAAGGGSRRSGRAPHDG